MTKIKAYFELIRLGRPIGLYLLLWPTLWSLWLSNKGAPSIKLMLVFCLGVFVMRSAGCVINDIVDRDIDPQVKRTKTRPLANQSIGLGEAYIVLFVLLCVALVLVLQLNVAALLWSVCGLALAVLYPFCKRFISAPQLVLGFAFSWSIPMVYSAGGFNFDRGFVYLWLGTILWIVVYDTFYALVDKVDDVKIGVRSTAILFGKNVGLITGLIQVLVLVLWGMVGLTDDLGLIYFFSLLVVFILFVRQQFLIQSSDSEQVFKAFTENHYVGLCVFFGIFADLLFRAL